TVWQLMRWICFISTSIFFLASVNYNIYMIYEKLHNTYLKYIIIIYGGLYDLKKYGSTFRLKLTYFIVKKIYYSIHVIFVDACLIFIFDACATIYTS
ncbi:hypothetical protein ACJX0J_012516, partial [Zea mays]